MKAIINELEKLGAEIVEGVDFIIIHPPEKVSLIILYQYNIQESNFIILNIIIL